MFYTYINSFLHSYGTSFSSTGPFCASSWINVKFNWFLYWSSFCWMLCSYCSSKLPAPAKFENMKSDDREEGSAGLLVDYWCMMPRLRVSRAKRSTCCWVDEACDEDWSGLGISIIGGIVSILLLFRVVCYFLTSENFGVLPCRAGDIVENDKCRLCISMSSADSGCVLAGSGS